MWNYFFIISFIVCTVSANKKLTYTTYNRNVATCREKRQYEENRNTEPCLVSFDPCDESDWRRIDGSCNNLKYPSHGTKHTPEWRLLPAHYSEGFQPRKMKSGKDFPLGRPIRAQLLEVGGGIDEKFTTAMSYFLEFVSGDFVSIHDIENFVLKTTYCCEPEGLKDPMCVPNYMEADDDVHRFSGHRCINMTRPLTFQNAGCVSTDTTPSRINMATVHLDMSMIYYYNGSASDAADRRVYKGGKLKVEVVNGVSLPSDATKSTTCFIKTARETGCLRKVPNSVAGTNIFSAWFWRLHNHHADELAKRNPHLTDDQLFHRAMDINIAVYNQILFYEAYAELLGREAMVKEGILNCHDGFRDPYNADIPPSTMTEFVYGFRWLHKTQDGTQKLYDKNHNLFGTAPMVNLSLKVEDLAYNNYMEGYTNGLVTQPAGQFKGKGVDPDIVNLGLGPLQMVFDIVTNDLTKGRYFGLAPYAKYRDACSSKNKKHEKFEDLKDVISAANLELLQTIYEDILDIEFLAGLWSETIPDGIWVPPTLHYIMMKQLKKTVRTDRHWYERPNRPHAFTRAQLKEIRKASLAWMLCTISDSVLSIQPKAFLRIGPGNERVSCKDIPGIDYNQWTEKSQQVKKQKY